MSHLCCSMVIPLVWIQCFWIVGHVNGCGNLQTEMEGRCCDKCSPGTYLDKFCSENYQTTCAPCKEGSFADEYHSYDRCVECDSCQQVYEKNCTPTTNAVCACYPGFLCSNSICSHCQKNKCVAGESLKKTVVSSGLELQEYTYRCVDLCLMDEYFDEKSNLCKPRKQCHAYGLIEQLPRNKTHDSVCYRLETKRYEGDSILTSLVCGFVLLSVTFLLFASYNLIKKLRKHRAKKNPILEVTVNTDNFHLPKEESGLQFIIQDESDDSSSLCQP
ncbi:tumor necrosis factor receptor superfamily member 11B-like [Gouania willdenowi]|uniref:tumor necrosis factor receptor superfamily member 11B-like n=1 Tax=Gouania willdenowi TaxID=441366 RepID=UPI00105518B9|nr:tumor necrosis factor receptor superfamily member 11B-like [Gouania willdenowi]